MKKLVLKRRLLAGAMSAAVLTGLLTGCGSSSSESAKTDATTSDGTGETVAAESSEGSAYQTTYGDKQFDDVTITVELFDRSNAPSGSTITENKWTQYVNQEMNKVGINVEFVPVPRSDEITKMQTMVASQTAPDITITYTYPCYEVTIVKKRLQEISVSVQATFVFL